MIDKRNLIIGASGYIGRHLWQRLGVKQTVATYNDRPIRGAIPFTAGVSSLTEILNKADSVETAFIMVAMSNIDACAENRQLSDMVNVESVKEMIDILIERGIYVVFASSDAVYDGCSRDSTESETPTPIVAYGEQKREIEEYLAEKTSEYLCLRLSKVYGTEIGDGTLIMDSINRLMAGETVRAASDLIQSPAYIEDVVNAFADGVSKRLRGLYNAGGPISASRHQFISEVCEKLSRFENVPGKVISCSIDDFALTEKRPHDTSMDSARLYRALEWSFQPPSKMIDAVLSQEAFADAWSRELDANL
jgi:dTDP-4-dehydrorhamnose reductase